MSRNHRTVKQRQHRQNIRKRRNMTKKKESHTWRDIGRFCRSGTLANWVGILTDLAIIAGLVVMILITFGVIEP